MSHDPTCDACGVQYDRDLGHVCDPLDLAASLREEFRAALQHERARIASIIRDEAIGQPDHAAIMRRIADAIEEDE